MTDVDVLGEPIKRPLRNKGAVRRHRARQKGALGERARVLDLFDGWVESLPGVTQNELCTTLAELRAAIKGPS